MIRLPCDRYLETQLHDYLSSNWGMAREIEIVLTLVTLIVSVKRLPLIGGVWWF